MTPNRRWSVYRRRAVPKGAAIMHTLQNCIIYIHQRHTNVSIVHHAIKLFYLTMLLLSPALTGAKAIGLGAKAAVDPISKAAIKYFMVKEVL